MKEIGDVMEKLFYKKKETKKPVAEPESTQEPTLEVNQEDQESPWTRATSLDYKMKKKMKEAGV